MTVAAGDKFDVKYGNYGLVSGTGDDNAYYYPENATIYVGDTSAEKYQVAKKIGNGLEQIVATNAALVYTVGSDTMPDADTNNVTFTVKNYIEKATSTNKIALTEGSGWKMPEVTADGADVTVTAKRNGRNLNAGAAVGEGQKVEFTIAVTPNTGYYVDADTVLMNGTEKVTGTVSAAGVITFVVTVTVTAAP